MIAEKFIDRFARNSGIKDKLIAEREVVLTYALNALHTSGVMNQLAFKGGTALRKLIFGSSGRFSMDLDFTLCANDTTKDETLEQVLEIFARTHRGEATQGVAGATTVVADSRNPLKETPDPQTLFLFLETPSTDRHTQDCKS